MDLYSDLRSALQNQNAIALEESLGRVRSPASEGLAYALYEVAVEGDSTTAAAAVELLASIRRGRGMPHLVEALTRGAKVAPQIIETLDFASLGTGWGRIGRALGALKPYSRQRLIARLGESPECVPPRRWVDVALTIDHGAELDELIHIFEATRERLESTPPSGGANDLILPDPEQEGVYGSALIHALMIALLERLQRVDDPDDVAARLARLLVEQIPKHHFIGRRIVQMLARDGVCPRNRLVLEALSVDVAALARSHIEAAVPSFVSLAGCDDEKMSEIALDTLHALAGSGSPEDWYRLLQVRDRPKARALALRAFEQQPGDVGWVLGRILRARDPEVRIGAVDTINHRLVRGRPFGVDAFQGFMRVIARAEDGAMGEHLDVGSVVRLTGQTQRFFAVIELLRTSHPELLARTVTALEDPEVASTILEGGPPDLMVSALSDALAFAAAHELEDTLDHLAHLMAMAPVGLAVSDLDLVLPALHSDLVDRILSRLELDDREWMRARDAYLGMRDGKVRIGTLRRLRDPHRAWVLIGGILSGGKATEVGVKVARELGNPTILGRLIGVCVARTPEGEFRVEMTERIARELARSFDALPHPDVLSAVRQRARDEADPALRELLERGAEVVANDLEQLEPRGFSWPPAEQNLQLPSVVHLWSRHGAFHKPTRSLTRRLLGRPARGTRAHGKIMLSDVAWWQRDRLMDEVIQWGDAVLDVRRENLPDDLEWDVLVLTVRHFEDFGAVDLGVRVWVRASALSRRLHAVPIDASPFPFVRFDETRPFLATLRTLLESVHSGQAHDVIAALTAAH